ncbi:MAG: DUF6494 family protein [Alphaproteobacteria bacterium]
MNEDVFNIAIRKFLKRLGVTAQREIEAGVRKAVESGAILGTETLKAHATVTVEGVPVRLELDGDIALE